jgi:glycine betaine/proline transport system ATP-binding protein
VTVRIEIRGLGTVFGPRPHAALAQARAGAPRAQLVAAGHTPALVEVDLDIRAGEVFVVMGLSGSGKSTLVRHINRLVEPTAGRVAVDGRDVLAMRADELVALRRERISMVFQGFGLLDHLNVLDNVAFGLALRGVGRAERQAKALHWIERVALHGFEGHVPAQLSGGMRQRVGLARALCSGNDIVLMDEPFSALDPPIRAQLQAELLGLQAEARRTVVFITHDLDEALRLGDRIAVLRDGRVAQVGTPRELLLAPADAGVAAFVRDVNRARALPIGAALVPWPAGVPLPLPDAAIDAELPIEQVLPRLAGQAAPLALRRDGAVVGQVSPARLRELLAPPA